MARLARLAELVRGDLVGRQHDGELLVVVIGGAGLMLHKREQSSYSGGGGDVGKK